MANFAAAPPAQFNMKQQQQTEEEQQSASKERMQQEQAGLMTHNSQERTNTGCYPQTASSFAPQQQQELSSTQPSGFGFFQLQPTVSVDQILSSLQQNPTALAAGAFLGATHNLIPPHLQANGTPLGILNGTPGYPPALIPHPIMHQAFQQPALPSLHAPIPQPVFTVQDRPMVQPVYNGVNPAYPGLRVLNTQPPVFCVDNFLTLFESEFLIRNAHDSFGPAPVVGKGAGEVSPSRTSSTCYLAREDLPNVMRKISCLTGKPLEHCELPQVGRYFSTQQYRQHYDAFDLSTDDGRRFAANGGQRTITVLVYLNTVHNGGATRFPALNLDVQPVQGMALIFFPATVDGLLDKMALHAAMPAIDTKYVSQIWIRQSNYAGQPSKRLPQTLGLPFGHHAA